MYLGGYAYSEEFDVENNDRSRQTCLLTIWAARNEKAITSRNIPIKWQVWSIWYQGIDICRTLLQESMLMLTGDVLVDENIIRICDIIDNLTPTGNQ